MEYLLSALLTSLVLHVSGKAFLTRLCKADTIPVIFYHINHFIYFTGNDYVCMYVCILCLSSPKVRSKR